VADESRDLPVRAPLDRSALERVLARAAELQAAEGEGDEPGLSDAQLVEIAKEVGLAPQNLRQALAEERSRGDAPASRGALDFVFGGALASSSRTVRGTPATVMAALDLSMTQEEGLRVKRRFPDRTLWERAPGIVASISRAFDVAGRGYHLARTDDVGATVVGVDADRTLVRLDASLETTRGQHLAGGAVLALLGAAGSAVLFTLGVLPVVAALPVVGLSIAAWFAAREFHRARRRAQLALEQVLDRLERNERPRPSLLASIVTPVRPR
jgi:hypothetical protein